MSTEVEELKPTASKTAWKKQAVHEGVVCPSGAVITIKIPNVAELARSGVIPAPLVDIATQAQGGMESIPDDALEKLAELSDVIVAEMVVAPKIAPEDVKELPTEDISFLVEIAHRQRDIDALGNQIAGLDKWTNHARFRGESDGDEDVLYE